MSALDKKRYYRRRSNTDRVAKMIDLVKIRSMLGAVFFLLALALAASAFLTDEWIVTHGEDGSREDPDSNWWSLEIDMGARQTESRLEMYDPFAPVIKEHYNTTTYTYGGDLENGGQALEYSYVAVLFLLPISILLSGLCYFRIIPGSIPTSFALMSILLLGFGSYMFLNQAGQQRMENFIPDDEMLSVVIDSEDIDGIASNSSMGLSTYLGFSAIGALVPNALLFIGIQRLKKAGKKQVRRGFFRPIEERSENERSSSSNTSPTKAETAKVRRPKTIRLVDAETEETDQKEETGIRSGRL